MIHTRVPVLLEEELKRLARSLRLPVSNVVRNILQDAIEALDAVGRRAEGELHEMVERLSRRRDLWRRKALAAAQLTGAPSPRDEMPCQPTVSGASGREPSQPTILGSDAGAEASASQTICPISRPAVLEGVLAFEKLVLATDVPCTVCGRPLRAGETAHRAVFDQPGPLVLLGLDCRHVPGGARKEEPR